MVLQRKIKTTEGDNVVTRVELPHFITAKIGSNNIMNKSATLRRHLITVLSPMLIGF